MNFHKPDNSRHQDQHVKVLALFQDYQNNIENTVTPLKIWNPC